MSTFLTSIVPVISLIVGTWLGAKFSLRNTLRALEIQNRQKEKERAEEVQQNEQKELRSWFERYAIDECVDPLLGEILFLQQFFTRRMTKTHYGLAKEPEVEIPPMPYQACVRIFAISGAVNFTMLASIAPLAVPKVHEVIKSHPDWLD